MQGKVNGKVQIGGFCRGRSTDFEVALDLSTQRAALQLPPRRAPQDDLKMHTISRAEGGQLQAPVGAPLRHLPD
jgi:hypothetical protein